MEKLALLGGTPVVTENAPEEMFKWPIITQEDIDNVVEVVKATLPFQEVLITRAGCTVSSHCGRNTLGVIFIRKSPIA